MRRGILSILLICFCAQSAATVEAEPSTVREEVARPYAFIAKSVLCGALIGAVVALGTMAGPKRDPAHFFKVMFIGGTALGLGYGLYRVARASPVEQSTPALLKVSPAKKVTISAPGLSVARLTQSSVGVSVDLFSWNF